MIEGEGGAPEPPFPPSRVCEYCGQGSKAGDLFCSACGHCLGTPVTAAERSRNRARFDRAVREDISRVKGLVVFYLLILISTLGLGLLLKRDSTAFFAASASMALITGVGAVLDRQRVGPWLSRAGFGAKGYALILLATPATFLFAAVLSGALRRLLPIPEYSYSRPLLEDGYSWAWVVTLIAVEPGIFEELGFRGTILGRLEGLMKPRDALIVSAAVFAIIHLDLGMFPFLFLMGIYLGWLRQRSGSLYPGMVAHFAHNGLVVLAEAADFTIL